MRTIKAPAVMIQAAKKINRAERWKAMRLMEKVFKAKLKTLSQWDDFTPAQHVEMAAEAAAAEALWRFA